MRHLLLSLFQLFLGPMFLFASGATVLDVGTGGGGGNDGGTSDVGGTGDVADSGDTADADGEHSTTDGETRIDSADEADQDGHGETDTASVSVSGKVPPKIDKLFKLAKAQGLEKEVRQLYFSAQRLDKAIPGGVNAAIQLAKSVEEFGGIEGVQQLQSDLQSFTEERELFNRADPRWVESGFEQSPDTALKLFAHTLDYVADHHAEHYNHLMAKVIKNDLDSGLPVHDIYGILAGLKDNPKAQELAKELAAYYNQRNKLAKEVPAKKVDAQQKALTDREAGIEKKEMDLRFKEVNRDVFPALKNTVTKTLQAQAKVDGLDLAKLSAEYPAEWRSMLNEIHKKIMEAAAKDQRFIDKHYALVKKGDLKRAAAAVNAKHDAIGPDIARNVMNSYGVFRGKKAGPGNKNQNANKGSDKNNAAASQGWTRVSARPQNSTIDWSKTTGAMQLDGKYILNDGKKVIVQY